MTVAAALAHAWVAAAVLGVVSAALGGAVLWECGVATAWLEPACRVAAGVRAAAFIPTSRCTAG